MSSRVGRVIGVIGVRGYMHRDDRIISRVKFI
jgi:hypothetical protein